MSSKSGVSHAKKESLAYLTVILAWYALLLLPALPTVTSTDLDHRLHFYRVYSSLVKLFVKPPSNPQAFNPNHILEGTFSVKLVIIVFHSVVFPMPRVYFSLHVNELGLTAEM